MLSGPREDPHRVSSLVARWAARGVTIDVDGNGKLTIKSDNAKLAAVAFDEVHDRRGEVECVLSVERRLDVERVIRETRP